MMMVPCPWCGPRDAGEFRQAATEAVPRPDPGQATPEQWRAYLYLRANALGWVTETWYHRMGCRRYVTLERHTESHEFRPAAPEPARATGAAAPEAAAPEAVGHEAPEAARATGAHP